jgi:cytoskeletal protein RodZ
MAATKKTTTAAEKKVETAKDEAPKAEAVKAVVKEEAPKAEVKETAKATVKKAATVKKETKKATTKTTTAKKAPAKKAEQKVELQLQFGGKSYTQEDLVKIAKDVWKYDLKQKAGDLTSIELYVKPEEGLAYYVMNTEFAGSFAI